MRNERTENPRHLLNSFTYRGLAGQHLVDKWLLSDEASQLARDKAILIVYKFGS